MNNILSVIGIGDSSLTSLIFLIIGGLGLFLYGINLLSNSLNSLAGNNLKTFVSKATNNIFKGFLIGILITVIIQSSSATTVIVVSLISAGLLDLKHAIPIMIGSHIGTTVMAFIIGLDIGFICYPLLFAGAIIILFFAQRKIKLSGRIVIGLGFLFLGLELMSISFGSFADEAWFNKIMITLGDNLFLSFIVGTFLTALIQSSGAFIGIVQELYITTAQMSLATSIALVVGSNIGTSVTACIASLGGNKTSKEAALANTLTVLVGAIIVLPLIHPVTQLFSLIENGVFGSKNMFTIAFFHAFYNIVCSGLALLLIKYIVKIVEFIIPPEKIQRISAENLSLELLKTPSLALESARLSMIEMNDLVLKMYDLSINYFNENNNKYYDEINSTEEVVDLYEHLIHDYLMQLSETHLVKKDSFLQTEYIDVIRDYERIADHAVNFSEFLKRYYEEKNMMSPEMHDALLKFFEICREQVYESVEAFKNSDKNLAKSVIAREAIIDDMEVEYRHNVHSYLRTGEISQLDILYIDIVSNLERISDHATNICEMIIDPHMMSTMITGSEK